MPKLAAHKAPAHPTRAHPPSHAAPPQAAPAALASAHADPLSASPQDILQLQHHYGNRAVVGLLNRPAIQPSLNVGPANDVYEREADRIAAEVAGGPVPRGPARVQREPAAPAVGAEGGPLSHDLESEVKRARGGGQALDGKLAAHVGRSLGADLSGVRVHTDSRADQLNRSLNARAFTYGRDIYFSRNAYQPGSSGGQRLLAHELTHVVQQGAARPNKLQTKRLPVSQAPAGAQRLQREVMDVDAFKASTNERRRGGYIKKVDQALAQYHAEKTAANLTALRFAIEKYLEIKGDGDDQKMQGARALLAQVREEEASQPEGDQIKALLPYADDIKAMLDKWALLKLLDKKLKGHLYAREALKTAIINSSLPTNKLDDKLRRLNLTDSPDEGQLKLVEKLTKELTKSQKAGAGALYRSLYARCLEIISALYMHTDKSYELKSHVEAGPARDLVDSIEKIARMEAETFDISYSQRLAQQREAAIAGAKAEGKEPLDVVVLGAGPVGLIAAIEAALNGANVHIYEMRRTGPARANVLKLTDPTFHKLRRLGVFADLFGPDRPKGSMISHGVSVAFLEDTLRARAAQLGIKITYGYQLDEIVEPDQEGGKTTVRLKKYVPTRPGPEKDLYDKIGDMPATIDCTSDLVIGATGAGGTTRKMMGLEAGQVEGEGGEEYIDFTAVGIFEPDGRIDDYIPGQDDERDNAWMVGLRTPAADYLLTQIARQQYLQFKNDDKGLHDWVADRGANKAKFSGKLKRASMFEITLNQAKQFVSEKASGVVIGDEAATPHPLTGSGFNTGVASTEFVPGLVKGLTRSKSKEDRTKAFSTYGAGVKTRTDKMIAAGTKFFTTYSKKLKELHKLPPPVPQQDQPVPQQDQPPQSRQFYSPEDLLSESDFDDPLGAYQSIQDQTDSLFGIPKKKNKPYKINPRKHGPEFQNPEETYSQIQKQIDALFGIKHTVEED